MLSIRKKHNTGVSLIELLIVLVILVILTSAIGFAFAAELNMRRMQEARRYQTTDANMSMRNEIKRLLEGAKISSSTTDATTFFIGEASGGSTELGCDRLTFTTTEPGVPYAAIASTDDYATQQTARGPVGGIAEVSLSTTAVGSPVNKSGLYERMQRPSDSDSSQGGIEWVLDMHISRIGFQFWNGQDWVSTWDTTSDRHLPEQVKISYTTTEQPDAVRVFIVSIPSSDVDSQNPDTQQSGA